MAIDIVSHKSSKFHPGQRWSYFHRSEDPTSTVLVVAVDDILGHVTVNVSIQVVSIGARTTSILAPVGLTQVEASLVALLNEGEDVDEFYEQYSEWRVLASQSKAGTFKMPISEIVNFIAKQA